MVSSPDLRLKKKKSQKQFLVKIQASKTKTVTPLEEQVSPHIIEESN